MTDGAAAARHRLAAAEKGRVGGTLPTVPTTRSETVALFVCACVPSPPPAQAEVVPAEFAQRIDPDRRSNPHSEHAQNTWEARRPPPYLVFTLGVTLRWARYPVPARNALLSKKDASRCDRHGAYVPYPHNARVQLIGPLPPGVFAGEFEGPTSRILP